MKKVFRRKNRRFAMSVRTKLTLALGAIAVALMLSSIISVLEYRRMSNYVSELIASNIRSINLSQKLAETGNEYNLMILGAIGDSDAGKMPLLDVKNYVARCDSLRYSIASKEASSMADSLMYAYSAYMLTSLELDSVLMSDFIDSRDWYFNRLQPSYNRFRKYIESLNDLIYTELKENSLTFEDSFYRSIIPGTVAVAAGLVLLLLLLYFLNVYYVTPLYRMLSGVDEYRDNRRKYHCTFDGSDQLSALNEGITEIIEDNIELRRRIKAMREDRHQDSDGE